MKSSDSLFAPAPMGSGRADRRATQRRRIIVAMAESVAEDGYAATTVAAVARRASVSTRAFYEHFADKEACFLEVYDTAVKVATSRLRRAVSGANGRAAAAGSWRRQLSAAITAWFALLASEPAFTRIYALEVWHATPSSQERAVAGTHTLLDVLASANRAAAREDARVHECSGVELQLLAGGVHRITVLYALEGRIPQLQDVAAAVAEHLIAAVSRIDAATP